MTPRHLLARADARRIPLASNSVHCCITSPPYFGLRDYGTGEWEGGSPGCDHKESVSAQRYFNGQGYVYDRGGAPSSRRTERAYRDICGKCGARRVDRQIGLEPDPAAYVAALVTAMREVRRVLRDDGCLWLNLGSSYASGGESGYKPKDLIQIPHLVSESLREDGWYLRSSIPWFKGNPMPESTEDRPGTSHEYVFLLTKRERYYYDVFAVRKPNSSPEQMSHNLRYAKAYPKHDESRAEMWHKPNKPPPGIHSRVGEGRNRRTGDWCLEAVADQVAEWQAWLSKGGLLHDADGLPVALHVATTPFPGSHFATFPPRLVRPMVLCGSSERGCCAACGGPWVRETEDGRGIVSDTLNPKQRRLMESGVFHGEWSGLHEPGWRKQATTAPKTLGWSPSCTCAAPVVPCRVLDPFAGAGTVPLVATGLGRHGIGTDLSAEYLAMARRRIERPHARPARAANGEQHPLFDGIGS